MKGYRIQNLVLRLLLQRGKRQVYRNMRTWAHIAVLAVTGFFNLFYAGIVKIIAAALTKFNETGLAFFDGAHWGYAAAISPFLLFHYCIAIASLVAFVASVDVLKERVLEIPLSRLEK